MKIETLKKSHLKRNIIIGIITVLLISAVILNFTRAKYRVTQSIPIVNGTINYTLPDLNIIGLYIDGEEVTELNSSKTYTLDTAQSTCTYKDGSAIDNLSLNYDSTTKSFSITPFTTKGTKCSLYFEEFTPSIKDTLLANYPTVLTRTDFSTIVTDTTTGTIYKSANSSQYDNDGEVYYFAGNPTDNWIKFGGFYWRIVRINGDGSIKIIYSGNEESGPVTNGEYTSIGTDVFNLLNNRSEYVGIKYTLNQQHGQAENSSILNTLNDWYNNNLNDYKDYIDNNGHFCSDRNMASGYSWSSNPSSTIYYAAYERLINNSPNIKCINNADIINIPIGLITADEILMSGSIWAYNSTGESNYLCTNRQYWTMTPYEFIGNHADMFIMFASGSMWTDGSPVVNISYDIRPVVNLKAEVQIIGGNGTASNPYVVS